MIKKVFTVRTIERGKYRVIRNYKLAKSKEIGRIYKTVEGAIGQARHRNACYRERYGSEFVGGIKLSNEK